MARTISPLTIRMQLSGSQEVENGIRRSAGFFGVVVEKAQQANRAMRDTSSGARDFQQEANKGQKSMRGVADETQKASKEVRTLADRTQDGVRGFNRMFDGARGFGGEVKEAAGHLKAVVGHAQTVFGIFGAIKAKSPLKLFDAIIPAGLVKKIGLGMIGTGVLGATLMGKDVAAAGIVQQIATGLKTTLKDDLKVDAFMGQIKAFDAKSPFDFQGSARSAQKLLGAGIRPADIPAIMEAVGDAVGANGGGAEEFEGVLNAIAQVKGKQRLLMEEVQQMAERNVNIIDVLAKKMNWTDDQKSKFMQGQLAVPANVAIPAITEGLREKFSGGMDTQAATLSGQVETLKGNIFQLQAAIGKGLVPAVTIVVGALNSAVGAFNSLPEPITKGIGYIGAFSSGLLILAGIWLYGRVTMMGFSFALKLLTFQIPFVNQSILGLSWNLVSKFIPSLAATGMSVLATSLVIGGLVVAIGALLYVSKMYYDELQKATATVEDARSAEQVKQDNQSVSDIQKAVADSAGMSKRDRYAVLKAATSKLAEIGEVEAANQIDAQRIRLQKELRAEGIPTGNVAKKAETSAGQALVDAILSKSGHKDARLKGIMPASQQDPQQAEYARMFGDPTKLQDELKKLQAGQSSAIAPSGLSPLALGPAGTKLRGEESADVQAAQGKVDALAFEIEQLQDQKRHTSDKELKKTLTDQIIAKQRLLRAARVELAATKKLASRQERDAARAEKAEEKSQDRVGDVEFDIKKSQLEDRFAGQGDGLERQLKAAKDRGDSTKVRSITQQLGNLKAQQQLELALMEADREKDAAVRTALRRKAQSDFRIAQNTATRDAKNAELDAKQEQLDIARKGDVDVKKATLQNETDAKIAPLEAALDAAREAKNFAQIRSITIQIESLKAEQAWAEEQADATLEDNKEKRRQMERLALVHKQGALAKALAAGDNAMRDAMRSDKDENHDRGARAALARMKMATRGGGLFGGEGMNPLRPGGMNDGVPSLADFGDVQSMNRERTARVGSITQKANGNWKIKFEEIELENEGIDTLRVPR